ncbi:MAG: GGDEF domain-containing protein [Beijerinckiaceae bacterium]|nr:GGDEF domain-containing protein [Beijerinckiaceae bacterium]
MTDFIDYISALADLRDRDELDRTLATAAFELAGAAGLSLWRVVRHEGDLKVRERFRLPVVASEDGALETALDVSQLPFLAARADLRLSYKAKQNWSAPAEAGGYRHIFPVSDGRDVLCLMEMDTPERLVTEQERMIATLIRVYGNHVGILNYGDQDELTGLLNRRTFDETVKQIAWPETTRFKYASPGKASARWERAHLAVADIDFFKRINDQFGHPYGDEVLVLMSRLMDRCFRDTDYLFRFGGEEFVIVLPGAGVQEAESAFERFRAAVEDYAFPQVGRVTISLGFTAIRREDTGSNAFGRADQALYVAKQGGRNKVCCYEMLVGAGILSVRASQEDNVELF